MGPRASGIIPSFVLGFALAAAMSSTPVAAQVFGSAVLKGAKKAPIAFAMGPMETVFEVPAESCPTTDFMDLPDVPARALRMSNGNILLVSGNSRGSYNLRGPTFDTLARDCSAQPFDSNYNTDPAQFNYQHWVASVYREPGNPRIFALVHNEYHDTVHVPPCTATNSPCIWTSVTHSYSDDNAATFVQPGIIPPVVAALPYPWDAYRSPIPGVRVPRVHGYFVNSNIIKYPDGYYYAFASIVGDPLHVTASSHICLMRTDDLSDHASWRFWDGTGFNHQTLNPYVNGVSYDTAMADPDVYFATPLNPYIDSMSMVSSLTYNTYLQAYMLIAVKGNPAFDIPCGFYYSLSTDLIQWSPPVLFREVNLPQCGTYEEAPWDVYPSVIDHDDASINFENADATFHLYFVHYISGTNRDVVRVPVTITLE